MHRTHRRTSITVGDILSAIWEGVVVIVRWASLVNRALRAAIAIIVMISVLPVGLIMLVIPS